MSDVAAEHRKAFGQEPQVLASAPGRVNLIGEHTDYNQGFVLPAAIDRRIRVAAGRRPDRRLRLFSLDFSEPCETDLDASGLVRQPGWAAYPAGMIAAMLEAGYALGGMDLTITGDVPLGSGLSSSAALEVACGLAAQTLYGLEIPGARLARLAQRAENHFVGVACGIMDQFISRLGREGHALLIDCRSLDHRLVPLILGDNRLLITNSRVPRRLVSSAYNQRRQECQHGATLLAKARPGTALRDFNAEDVLGCAGLDDDTRKRCRHVVEENARVLSAEAALLQNDLTGFGALMNASHDSLRDLFEVSCPQLDWLVERARETPGVHGSRMTGAGFGGCTVTLIEQAAIPGYQERLAPYRDCFGFAPELYVCTPSGGAEGRILEGKDSG
jgi:galactokinase